MSSDYVERRLAADVAGSCRLIGIDEEGTLARLKALRRTIFDPKIAEHHGRVVKNTEDGAIAEFASVVDAVRCADEIQRGMAEQNIDVPQDKQIELRIGIHVGDIIIEENDIFGDGVNIAVRLEGIAEPGGISISDDARRQIRGKVDVTFEDLGSQSLKNIAEPMRVWRVPYGRAVPAVPNRWPVDETLALPNKPSIAVLPFTNLSSDPEQEYFADGMVDDIITALSHFKALFVIARNSSFTYKGRAVDVKQVGRELGVRSRQANDEALRLFKRAIELDPDFASAYGRAAHCYAIARANGWISATPNEIAEVTRLAQRAVELGEDDAIALATGGWALVYVVRDLEGGAGLIDRALVLNSNLAEAWSFGGWVKNWLGEPELAIERFARAMRLSPLDPSLLRMPSGTAHAHFFLGGYDEAASWAAMALQDNPDYQPGLRIAAASNAMAGRPEQAHKAVARLRLLNPTLRVSTLKDVLGPFRRAEDLLRYEEGLRQAGLPE